MFGLVCLVSRLGLVVWVWFGCVGLVWYVWFGMFGLVGMVW